MPPKLPSSEDCEVRQLEAPSWPVAPASAPPRLTPRSSRGLLHPLIATGTMLAVLVTASVWVRWNLPMPRCAFKMVTGYPCFTCGATRALVALAGFDLERAWRLNPLITVLCLLVPLWLAGSVLRVVLGSRVPGRGWEGVSIVGTDPSGKWMWFLLGSAVLVNWAYLLVALPE